MSDPWWRGAALYQIYPLSFDDADGDGWGDLPGALRRLDHVASLDVDGIWLSPFYPSPMNDFGYDVQAYCDVDPRLGTLADFDALLARAHALGLRVLIDQVYTYTSHRHPWFEQSRSSRDNARHDWYVWADAKADGSPPNNWQSIFGGPAWEWDSGRQQYYLTHFYPEMPHLNVNLPQVQEALLEVADFWLARGVDGFRLDVINLAMVDPQLRDNPPAPRSARWRVPADAQLHLHDRSWPDNLDFVRRLQQRVATRPDGHTLAELTIETPRDRNYAYLAPGALDTAYYVLSPSEAPLRAEDIRGLVEEVLGADVWPTWAFSNHDMVRGPTRCGGDDPDPRLAELLIAILATLRGNVLIYQGDELGLPHGRVPRERLRDREGIRFHPHGLKRDGARTPMPWARSPAFGGQPWLPYDERHLALALEAQQGRSDCTLAATKGWLAQRRQKQVLRMGDMHMLTLPEPLLGWTRTLANESLLCIFNLGASAQMAALPADSRPGVLHASAGVAVDAGALALPPYGAALLRP